MVNKPNVSWEDIDKMIHAHKSDLMQVHKLKLEFNKGIDEVMIHLQEQIQHIHNVVLRKLIDLSTFIPLPPAIPYVISSPIMIVFDL